MNYTLAKELNEAGFKSYGRIFIKPDGSTYDWLDFETGGERLPTLSELIEACGEHFDSFEVRGKTYFSFGSSKDSSGMKINPFLGAGTSPEEAVARLWLAINRKEV